MTSQAPQWMREAAELANEKQVTLRIERAGQVVTIVPGVHPLPREAGENTCDDLFSAGDK